MKRTGSTVLRKCPLHKFPLAKMTPPSGYKWVQERMSNAFVERFLCANPTVTCVVGMTSQTTYSCYNWPSSTEVCCLKLWRWDNKDEMFRARYKSANSSIMCTKYYILWPNSKNNIVPVIVSNISVECPITVARIQVEVWFVALVARLLVPAKGHV